MCKTKSHVICRYITNVQRNVLYLGSVITRYGISGRENKETFRPREFYMGTDMFASKCVVVKYMSNTFEGNLFLFFFYQLK